MSLRLVLIQVVLLHESSTALYRSDNEGKSWSKVDDIQDVQRLIEHPHSKEIAFVIGRHTEHWVTHNRGASWQRFETKHEASRTAPPLVFHATQPDWVLFQGTVCEKGHGSWPWGGSKLCWDETYYTKDAFRSEPQPMLDLTSSCSFARSHKAVEADENLIFCITLETKPQKGHASRDARLYSSTNWFESKEYVDLGIGKKARGVVGMGIVSKFMVVAVKTPGEAKRMKSDPMQLYVSTDGKSWRPAQFPHSAVPDLVENAYTIVESTTHSIAVDVLTAPSAGIGTLFVSSGEGTYFVESLIDTNRNEDGIVDYEQIYSVDGVGIANSVRNYDEVVSGSAKKQLASFITFDDGSNWKLLEAPKTKLDGGKWDCDTRVTHECSLHLHSVSNSHNLGSVFSSTAPGFVMAVGSVGEYLLPYDECDTFLSTDAGLTWRMVREGAHKYEFGDQGSVLVLIDDEQPTSKVLYSYDGGANWKEHDMGLSVRVLVLTTIPDSTSQKFLVLGSTSRSDSEGGRYATIFLDFAGAQPRQCKDSDFERWYARSGPDTECLMGHKQWYQRRKLDAECYVGNKFTDPVGHDENCACTDSDYECDFNYVRQDGGCVAAGPEAVPSGVCKNPGDTYMGSSGYRIIPGNTCDRTKSGASKLDEKKKKDCTEAKPEQGKVSHVTHPFAAQILRHNYFSNSQTILLYLEDSTVWQSSNEGYSWTQLQAGKEFLGVTMHPYNDERAYLISTERKIIYTTDTGQSWNEMSLPADPNTLAINLLDFHPTKADWLIFTGSQDCSETLSKNCHAIAYYSTNHGRSWTQIEKYVRNCQWGRDTHLEIDETTIICESYKDKSGSQKGVSTDNHLQLVVGRNYYKQKEVKFDAIAGWTTFDEFMLIAQLNPEAKTLSLQVSLDGQHMAEARFPPGLAIDNHAYTVLESNTHSVFLHMSMSTSQGGEYGSIFKSNSNGTFYTLSIENVNRNQKGFVDFEKMIGINGIAMVNIVANHEQVEISGRKKLQTRITHNDGGRWKPLSPPQKDSLGKSYECDGTECSLQIHGYTARRDPKATYSSPSAPGLMMAVGNVGKELAKYEDSDVFLTRDGGFTWEEIRKDAHMWEYGDHGSILVLVNDEEPTDHVIYSTNEGKTWQTYSFGERLRVRTIQTVPQDTSRRFFLIGSSATEPSKSTLIHLDFSEIQTRKCVLNLDDPNNDDFELWSPAENRDEKCMFGRQTLYHRRLRDADCYIGANLANAKIERNCTCTAADFECEFNYIRKGDKCVLVDGASPLTPNTIAEQCIGMESDWYDRTEYRKIPFSSCEGGERLDRGTKHACPGLVGIGLGAFFWATVTIVPFVCAAAAGWWYLTKGERPGCVHAKYPLTLDKSASASTARSGATQSSSTPSRACRTLSSACCLRRGHWRSGGAPYSAACSSAGNRTALCRSTTTRSCWASTRTRRDTTRCIIDYAFAIHSSWRFTSSAMINFSISPSCSVIRSQCSSKTCSWNGSASPSISGGVIAPSRFSPLPFVWPSRSTNTTSCFRRCSSFPMTSWWPYRASAARALGISRASSVSSWCVSVSTTPHPP